MGVQFAVEVQMELVVVDQYERIALGRASRSSHLHV